MAQTKRAAGSVRRSPRQQRSVQAVEAIFEATAKLVESQGPAALTTARIAEVAGYGVGTVYDYFPNKNAILVAMARRELDRVVRSIQKALKQADEGDTATATQRAIRALIRGFGGRQSLRGALLTSMIAQGHSSELATPIEMIIEFLREQESTLDANDWTRLLPERLYVLTRAVVGVIRAWAMEGTTRVSAQALEIELTELVRSYARA